MKKRGILQSLVGLLWAALVIYFIFFAAKEEKIQFFEQWERFWPIIFIVGIPLSIIGYIYFRRSRKALEEFAVLEGFSLSPKEDYPAFSKKIKWSRLIQWSGFRESEPRKIRHLMQGKMDSDDVAIFDHVISSGEDKEFETAVLFESEQLSLPPFCLRPEGILHKIGSAFGDPDIDFSEFPKFSSQYLLQGPEEEVRNVFNSNVLSYFENHPGWTVEGFGAQLLVYLKKQSIASKEDFQELLQYARTIFQLFK